MSAAETKTSLATQIGQTAGSLKTEVGSLQTQFDDAKARLIAIESRTSVTKEVSSDGRALTFATVSAIVSVISVLVAAGSLIYAILK